MHLYPQCYQKYNIDEKMKEMDAYEGQQHIMKCSQIWKRENYEYKYCNKLININYKKQYCILGLEAFKINKDLLQKLYLDPTNDFLLLDSENDIQILTKELDESNFDRMKCYKLADSTKEDLLKYFLLLYKSCYHYSIIDSTNIPPILKEKKISNSKKITIITPCIRPENLIKIKESINFDYVDSWFIIYDGTKIKSMPNVLEKNDKIKEYIYVGEGISGNPQRNYALGLIENTDTYLYYLDDDNIIHNDLYLLLDNIESGKMYTFDQARPKNVYPYKEVLLGDSIEIYNIDTAMFLIDFNLCQDINWQIEKYNADGYYIKDCYEKNKENWMYVNKTMAYYNKLV
jgi:hypothetical protein